MARRMRGRPLVFVDANVLIRGMTLPRFPFPPQLERFERFLGTGVIAVVDDPSESAVRMHLELVQDEDDVPVALAAIEAGAEYLVSTDPDLTVVDTSTEELRRWIIPLRPGDFLKEVLGWTSTELSRIETRTWEALEAAGDG